MMALSPVVSRSSMPDISVFADAKEMPDEVLGAMRGRFVAGGQVVQFGVQMVSSWQTTAGETLRAGAELRVNNLNTSSPVVQFVPTLSVAVPAQPAPADPATTSQTVGTASIASAVSSASVTANLAAAAVVGGASSPTNASQVAAANTVSAAAGIDSVSGVAQTIQLAGDHNLVTQSTAIGVSSAPLAALGTGNPILSGPGTRTALSPSGSSITVTLEPKTMMVQLSVPGQGVVMQRIRGGGARGAAPSPSLLQATRLAGDLQTVQSALTLRVQITPRVTGFPSIPTSLLQGIRPVGAY